MPIGKDIFAALIEKMNQINETTKRLKIASF